MRQSMKRCLQTRKDNESVLWEVTYPWRIARRNQAYLVVSQGVVLIADFNALMNLYHCFRWDLKTRMICMVMSGQAMRALLSLWRL